MSNEDRGPSPADGPAKSLPLPNSNRPLGVVDSEYGQIEWGPGCDYPNEASARARADEIQRELEEQWATEEALPGGPAKVFGREPLPTSAMPGEATHLLTLENLCFQWFAGNGVYLDADKDSSGNAEALAMATLSALLSLIPAEQVVQAMGEETKDSIRMALLQEEEQEIAELKENRNAWHQRAIQAEASYRQAIARAEKAEEQLRAMHAAAEELRAQGGPIRGVEALTGEREAERPACIPSHIADSDWTVIDGRAVWRAHEVLRIADSAPDYGPWRLHSNISQYADRGPEFQADVPQSLFLAARRWMGWEPTLTPVDLTELREAANKRRDYLALSIDARSPLQETLNDRAVLSAVEKLLSSGGAP